MAKSNFYNSDQVDAKFTRIDQNTNAAKVNADAAKSLANTAIDGVNNLDVMIKAIMSSNGIGPSSPVDGQTAALLAGTSTQTRAIAEEISRLTMSSAATQYVDYATGKDSNDGTVWAKAKKTVAAALRALPFVGGAVVMSSGTHLVSNVADVWIVDKPVTITGMGRGVTFLETNQGDSGFIKAWSHNVNIRDMTFTTTNAQASMLRTQGTASSSELTSETPTRTQWSGWVVSNCHGIKVRPNFTAQARTTGYGTPLYRDDATDVSIAPRIDRCEFEGYLDDGGVLIAGGRGAVVNLCYIHDSGKSGTTGDAVKIMHGAEAWIVSSTVIARSTRDGLDCYNARGGTVSNVTVVDCAVNGIETKWRNVENPRVDRVQVIGCRVIRCGNGIHASVPDVTLIGNVVQDCTNYGIRVGGSVDETGIVTTVGGLIVGNLATGTKNGSGFVITNDTSNISIMGNRASDNAVYGFNMTGANVAIGNSANNNGLTQANPGNYTWNYTTGGLDKMSVFMGNQGSAFGGEYRLSSGQYIYSYQPSGDLSRLLGTTTSGIMQLGGTTTRDAPSIQLLTPTGGTITTKGEVTPFTTKTDNLGTPSLRYNETHTETVCVGGLYLRNNSGVLEQSTDKVSWKAV